MIIQAHELVKRYDDVVAVDRLSFEVERGELFGMLGPNGAGKTTTIRIMMDILQPDEGSVSVLGEPPGQVKDRVGYLPEERGLYHDLKVLDTLVYLAELKGVERSRARERAMALLERVRLDDWAERKVKDLSRGMQQRLQFVASIVHDPQVMFLDEPFQGLDPVNTERLKGFVDELHRAGKTIILSSHQMNLVEALCDRILLINQGRALLYGPLAEIKQRYAPNSVRVRTLDGLPDLPGVAAVEESDGAFNLTLAEGTRPQEVLRALVERGVEIRAFEVAPVPLEDIFVDAVSEEQQEAGGGGKSDELAQGLDGSATRVPGQRQADGVHHHDGHRARAGAPGAAVRHAPGGPGPTDRRVYRAAVRDRQQAHRRGGRFRLFLPHPAGLSGRLRSLRKRGGGDGGAQGRGDLEGDVDRRGLPGHGRGNGAEHGQQLRRGLGQ